MIKLGGESGKQYSSGSAQKSAHTREVLTLETERNTQQATEQVFTSTKRITVRTMVYLPNVHILLFLLYHSLFY